MEADARVVQEARRTRASQPSRAARGDSCRGTVARSAPRASLRPRSVRRAARATRLLHVVALSMRLAWQASPRGDHHRRRAPARRRAQHDGTDRRRQADDRRDRRRPGGRGPLRSRPGPRAARRRDGPGVVRHHAPAPAAAPPRRAGRRHRVEADPRRDRARRARDLRVPEVLRPSAARRGQRAAPAAHGHVRALRAARQRRQRRRPHGRAAGHRAADRAGAPARRRADPAALPSFEQGGVRLHHARHAAVPPAALPAHRADGARGGQGDPGLRGGTGAAGPPRRPRDGAPRTPAAPRPGPPALRPRRAS